MSLLLSALSLDSQAQTELLAPRLGRFTAAVVEGQVVVPGQVLGTLLVARRRYSVAVPAGVVGRIASLSVRRREAPLQYGALIALIVPLEGAAHGPDTTADEVDGTLLRAAMDGQLYLRPSPAEPPFVQVGQRVEPGDTIAMIEVMKFFYPWVYEGAEAVEVQEVVAADATPISAGDAVFRVTVPS